MGLGDFVRKVNDKKLTNNGFMTAKQAKQFAQSKKMCKHDKCSESPGGHNFRFAHSKDFCREHARTHQNNRNESHQSHVAKKKGKK